MPEFTCWTFPHLPSFVTESLFENDKKLAIVGVIGKSACLDGNKMLALDAHNIDPNALPNPQEGQIEFYYSAKQPLLLLHFQTAFDDACMKNLLEQELEKDTYDFMTFNQQMRNRFARMLLFATQVCHIIVFVELNVAFDSSLLPMFKALKIVREKHILKFLPKLIKNSGTGVALGRPARLCSPRVLFLFENFPNGYEKSNESISKLEFEVEDNIYRMLRNEFIISNNFTTSLFSIANNRRFVYFNTKPDIHEDVLLKTLATFEMLLEKDTFKIDEDEDVAPYKGFGRPLFTYDDDRDTCFDEENFLVERKFTDLLDVHVEEILATGANDNTSKLKGKNHFVLLSAKAWYEMFQIVHKIMIENSDDPNFETNDPDYKIFLDNFDQLMSIDDVFFETCCDIGVQKALAMYNNPTLTHYNSTAHFEMVNDAISLYKKYARGPHSEKYEAKLREQCDSCWKNGKQQCEYPSLRGNLCVMPKHIVVDVAEHSSGIVFRSTCNCGRSQGRREDPYTIRQANFDFYEYMARNCNLCVKVKRINFAVFQPSIHEYRAAELEIAFPKLVLNDALEPTTISNDADSVSSFTNEQLSQPLTAANSSQTDLSLQSIPEKIDGHDSNKESSEDSLNELIIHVEDKEERERNIYRQPSTTEYLPGMVHTETPAGLLPQFPSWSLVCVGQSAVYSHNTGLMEHFQSGFLSGANFLLPWDVHVRLEHSASWLAEKLRFRQKKSEVFVLKIFIGFEYECPRGHRFIMSAPDKVMKGSAMIQRDSGSKVVFNNMPLYFPCPCRTQNAFVAQLMRVHVVTPKAPVNVILDPKVRTGPREYVFTMGLPNPPKLTQSAYWILRLPYIYQGDDLPILPPKEITASNALQHGCLLSGMFGVTETEIDE